MNVMSHRLWLTAALAVGFASLGAAQSNAQNTDYVPGKVVVKFRPGFAGMARTTHAMINARVTREMAAIGYQTVQLRPGMTVEQGVKYYKNLAGVESVSPDYRVHAYYTPNDPRYNNQWWLKKVGAPTAWDYTLGAPTVKIGVVDSGVDYNHEDLKGKVILGRDVVNNDADPMDDDSHGTHVAGISAANTNNGVGIAGLGFNSQIIAVKVLDGNGDGTMTGAAEGVINAVDLGAQVINLSLGGPGDVPALKDAINYATTKNVVVVAAAGNDGSSVPGYPGAYEQCICVAATDENDLKTDFSTWGSDWVDVAAPGIRILSTVPNNGYEEFQGTSMASPVVAGLAGLLRAYAPAASAADIRIAIESTTVNVGNFISKGRIDATAALASIIKPVDMDAFVKSASIYSEGTLPQGRNLLGGSADLKTADNKSVSVETIYVPQNGSMASGQFAVNFPVTTQDLVDGTITLRHSSRREATNSLFIYNYRTGKYDLLKSTPGVEALTTTSVALPKKMADYLSGGEIRFVVRAYVSSRASRSTTAFRLNVDQLMIKARIRPTEE